MSKIKYKRPPFRKLKGYAFDPSLSMKVDTALINNIIYKIGWEELEEGPMGEYIEVVDFDPTTKRFYAPVDLNDSDLLAQDGLEPAETNPQFHQQMVYAVSMTTIKNFENALGRKVLWAPRRLNREQSEYETYVGRLRIYPHALRDANAYYSPQKKAILFGYFESHPVSSTLHMPSSFVYTCLSHDIIAHEVTHAILDGMFPGYARPTNPDVLAFHEAFADIVALFQHFTFPEVLKHQISKTRGDLGAQNLLGELAQEFGSAIGSYGSLRDAIGEIDKETKKWKPKEPTGSEYATEMEPHIRGSILVSAIFEAFLTIYKNRVKDLLRIATGGSGILPQGELHPDLVNRLAKEASKAASHVLNMCIRALDYCPPVDITFGDYLRAIITADAELVKEDTRYYRLAFIEAFRRRGIYPKGIKTFSIDSLGLKKNFVSPTSKQLFKVLTDFLRHYRNAVIYEKKRINIYKISKEYIAGRFYRSKSKISGLHSRLYFKFDNSDEFEELTGLIFGNDFMELGIRSSATHTATMRGPSFQIENLRAVSRVGPQGNVINQIVFSLVQRSGVRVSNGVFAGHFTQASANNLKSSEFYLYGGCTMIFDLDSLELKYIVSKPLLDVAAHKAGIRRVDKERAEQQFRYQNFEGPSYMSEYSLYFGDRLRDDLDEPFAFLHR